MTPGSVKTIFEDILSFEFALMKPLKSAEMAGCGCGFSLGAPISADFKGFYGAKSNDQVA